MNILSQPLVGAFHLGLELLPDDRGAFVKTFNRAVFSQTGIKFDFREEYYSISKKNVIRGMHFQLPPYAHEKMVYCAVGEVKDVLLDLRPGTHYGAVCDLDLSADKPSLVIIPKGVAHGFKSLSDGSLMVYKTSTEYAPAHDGGILFNSFGFDWDCPDPILSPRDRNHSEFIDFHSPF